MRAVVISGGDGFIGSHLAKYLSSLGFEVYAIVENNSPNKNLLKGYDNIHVIEGNLDNYDIITPFLPSSPEAFCHFAWAGVGPDKRKDFVLQMKNVELSTNAVRLAASVGAKKFIFPGSTMEYVYYGKPINREAIPSPLNAYGVAKISARYTCSILCNELNVSFVYSVISSVYSESRNDNNVISYTINMLLNNEKPRLTKLEQLWDYVHIDDVVYGLGLLIEHGRRDGFYSIGHGDNWPLSKYIIMIRDIIDSSAPLGIGELPYEGEKMPCSCVDLNSIYEDTGFIPKIPFEVGIKRVISEIRKRKQGELGI